MFGGFSRPGAEPTGGKTWPPAATGPRNHEATSKATRQGRPERAIVGIIVLITGASHLDRSIVSRPEPLMSYSRTPITRVWSWDLSPPSISGKKSRDPLLPGVGEEYSRTTDPRSPLLDT